MCGSLWRHGRVTKFSQSEKFWMTGAGTGMEWIQIDPEQVTERKKDELGRFQVAFVAVSLSAIIQAE